MLQEEVKTINDNKTTNNVTHLYIYNLLKSTNKINRKKEAKELYYY